MSSHDRNLDKTPRTTHVGGGRRAARGRALPWILVLGGLMLVAACGRLAPDPDPGPAEDVCPIPEIAAPEESDVDPIRINAGGPALVTADGRAWESDDPGAYAVDGETFDFSDDGFEIDGTEFDELYLTERSSSTDLGSFSYEIPVPEPGLYQVRVHLAEVYYGGVVAGASGQRVFDFVAEGRTYLDGYDIVADVGSLRATVKAFAVDVQDGVLNLDFSASVNRPKVSAIEVLGAPDRPTVVRSRPSDGATDVIRSVSVTNELFLPSFGVGVDGSTLDDRTVMLCDESDGTLVDGAVETSGGRDSLVFTPKQLLEPETRYVFIVTDEVRDLDGLRFLPYVSRFTTGDEVGYTVDPNVTFDKIEAFAGNGAIASLQVGPDGYLYGTGMDGVLRRWEIDTSTGGLGSTETFDGLAGRVLIGLAFDPSDPTILYVTHNDPLDGNPSENPADDFSGAVARITIDPADFAGGTTVEDFIVGLPRSISDHMSNSLVFGPDGDLYLAQGSHTGAGAVDAFWVRPERLLTGAVLRIHMDRMAALGSLPLNVQTEDYQVPDGDFTLGDYSPYPDVGYEPPVTLYATGLRNAYDLVWHTDGSLYAPTNGTNDGSVTPEGPDSPSVTVNVTPDLLYQLEEGGYYGHPNPIRDEWVLLGGNPTGAVVDGDEILAYPTGVQPDPNYRGFVFNFGDNISANGATEYVSGTFGGALQGKLLVTRFQVGQDIVAIDLDDTPEPSYTVVMEESTGYPLDVTEDPRTGALYVSEISDYLGTFGYVYLLRPR
jgi:glucose/arabinose dehydrogenase